MYIINVGRIPTTVKSGEKEMKSVSKPSPMVLSAILIIIISSSNILTEGAEISVYWGQNGHEGTLSAACSSGNYDILNIAYLSTFGNGQPLTLNLAGHCNPAGGGCADLSKDIVGCQAKGIKVFLSIGGDSGDYTLSSPADAREVGHAIWYNFLGGNPSGSGPLGDVILDGIDFDIRKGTTLHWEELVESLLQSHQKKKIYLSASPRCSYPDMYLDKALQTGHFDYVWLKFYDNYFCEYSGDMFRFLTTWDKWRSQVRAKAFFLGLPPSYNAAHTGYIATTTLIHEIIPELKKYSAYEGIMVSSRFYDLVTGYSSTIRPFVHSPRSLSPSHRRSSNSTSNSTAYVSNLSETFTSN